MNAGPQSTPSTIIPQSNPRFKRLKGAPTNENASLGCALPYTKLHLLGHMALTTCELRGRKHLERKVNYASFLPPTTCNYQLSTGSYIFSKYHNPKRLSTVLGRNAAYFDNKTMKDDIKRRTLFTSR